MYFECAFCVICNFLQIAFMYDVCGREWHEIVEKSDRLQNQKRARIDVGSSDACYRQF